jgi:hypothetical protein
MKTTVVSKLASLLQARQNCIQSQNLEWEIKHTNNIYAIVMDYMPHGSGIDNEMMIDLDRSNTKRIVFTFGFHHMNEDGYYDGWTDHELWVYPAFDGIDMRITGPNRNWVKDHLYDTFNWALTSKRTL